MFSEDQKCSFHPPLPNKIDLFCVRLFEISYTTWIWSTMEDLPFQINKKI